MQDPCNGGRDSGPCNRGLWVGTGCSGILGCTPGCHMEEEILDGGLEGGGKEELGEGE